MKSISASSLRIKIVLAFAVPLWVMVGILLAGGYYQAVDFIRSQAEDSARRIGNVLAATLTHAMNNHDTGMLADIVRQSSAYSEDIRRVRLIDENYTVTVDSDFANAPKTAISPQSSECFACHQYTEGQRPRAVAINLPEKDTLRVATPIENTEACRACHNRSLNHIGVLLVDVSVSNDMEIVSRRFLRDLLISLGIVSLVSLFIFFLLDYFVTRRIRHFAQPLRAYASGDFSMNLPLSPWHDELDELALSFNDMLSRLERNVETEKKHRETMQFTVLNERERIARELHDSLPQLLAYFNAKLGAVSLLVQQDKRPEALQNLKQMEDASRKLFTDVRETIIGLRASRLVMDGLPAAIEGYVEQFRELCQIPVHVDIDLACAEIEIDPQVEMQVLRIAQEALSNVRKHADARRVTLRMECATGWIVLEVVDDGCGFDTLAPLPPGKSHFGLQTMRERAESHGGTFVIQSAPGKGTSVLVSLPFFIEEQL